MDHDDPHRPPARPVEGDSLLLDLKAEVEQAQATRLEALMAQASGTTLREIGYATPSWAERRRAQRRKKSEYRHVERRLQDRRRWRA